MRLEGVHEHLALHVPCDGHAEEREDGRRDVEQRRWTRALRFSPLPCAAIIPKLRGAHAAASDHFGCAALNR